MNLKKFLKWLVTPRTPIRKRKEVKLVEKMLDKPLPKPVESVFLRIQIPMFSEIYVLGLMGAATLYMAEFQSPSTMFFGECVPNGSGIICSGIPGWLLFIAVGGSLFLMRRLYSLVMRPGASGASGKAPASSHRSASDTSP